jgi:glycyl-tRNA synthetase alpha subunit
VKQVPALAVLAVAAQFIEARAAEDVGRYAPVAGQQLARSDRFAQDGAAAQQVDAQRLGALGRRLRALFQQVGGLDVFPVAGELTIGLERLSLYLQNKDNVYDLKFNDQFTYGDIYLPNEQQFSAFELEVADVATCKRQFEDMEREVVRILGHKGRQGQSLALPAYDHVLKASHLFNIMDARGAIAVAERQSYIGRVRDLTKMCAEAWVGSQGGNA